MPRAVPAGSGQPMTLRWGWFLVPPFIFSAVLMSASQLTFLEGSFHRDLSLGRSAPDMSLFNYSRLVTDTFYLGVLWITVKLSAIAALATLALGYPVAYVISRWRSRFTPLLLAGIVVATFVTIVIKAFGLIVIFSADGLLNRTLLGLGLIRDAYSIFGTQEGIVFGLMQFTIGYSVLVLYSVIQTIPRSLEEAAEAHGASRARVYWRIVLPLSIPGLVVAGLTIFNMCMGAFTSAALLGGGRVFTLPVLIQRSVMMETKYGMGATLAVVLLISTLTINLVSLVLVRRIKAARTVTG